MALTIAEARALAGVASVPLLTITTRSGAVLRFSDRVIPVGGYEYDSFLLSAADIEESLERDTSIADNSDFSFTLRNAPIEINGVSYPTLIDAHDAHPLHAALVSLSYVFKRGADISPATPAFSFVSEEPQSITRLSLTIRCSSMPAWRARTFALLKLLTADYPLAFPADAGKVLPDLTGWFRYVECLRTRWPVFATDNVTALSSSITNSSTTFTVTSTASFGDDSDEEQIIWVDTERCSWATKDATRFYGIVRGLPGGAAASAHNAAAPVKEHPETTAEVTVAGHEIHSLTSVWGEYEGKLARITSYTPTLSPARSYLVIPKTSLVVPSSLVSSLTASTNIVPTLTRITAQNDGFQGTSSSNSISKTFTWGAHPYQGQAWSGLQLGVSFSVSPVDPISDYNGSGSVVFSSIFYLGLYGYPAVRVWTGGTYFHGYETTPYKRSSTFDLPSPYTWSMLGYGWQTQVVLTWYTGVCHGWAINVSSCWQEFYPPAVAVGISGTVSDEKYFTRIFANGWGKKSADVAYGTVGTAITRPDYVMRSWIVGKLGFAEADIDTASFDAAGTFYTANAYQLSVTITDDVDPEEELYRMAFESRSVVSYSLGKWYLSVIPGTAPAATKTILRTDLAGEGADFLCGFTDLLDVQNSLTVKYYKNHGPTSSSDPWHKTFAVADVPAGEDEIPATIELRHVALDAMAKEVAAVVLLQRKQIHKTIEFSVFWDATDIKPGDTIASSGGGFWEGEKFFIVGAVSSGVNRATYRGIAWW